LGGQDDNLDVTTYIVLLLEKNFVQISDLAPGTAYLFRVQALGGDGSPGGSSIEEQFETSPEGTEGKTMKRERERERQVSFIESL